MATGQVPGCRCNARALHPPNRLRASFLLGRQRQPAASKTSISRGRLRSRCAVRPPTDSDDGASRPAVPQASQLSPAAGSPQHSRPPPLWKHLAGGLLLAAVAAMSAASPAHAGSRCAWPAALSLPACQPPA